jgi:hypothetical protein
MRAAAVAIVFIFGAAVILVFANSLNSWVLGGLIGGLAALLISIPISVMLFTFLSRHHDLKLQAIHQELGEMGYVDLDENGYEEVYDTDAYLLSEEEFYNQAENRRMADVRALPAAGQSQAYANREFTERTGRPTQSTKRSSQALPQGHGKGTPTRDLSSDRHLSRRSMYEVNAMRSRFQTAALHAARLEAQQFDDAEVIQPHAQAPNKRIPPGRTSKPLAGQPMRSRQAPSGGSHLTFDTTSGQQNGPRRTISSGELYPAYKPPRTDALHTDDLQADRRRIRSSYPETDSLRMHPQTGQMARNPQSGEPLRNPDMMTGNLKTPLVRRAPYLYKDDPLREELAQQIDGGPIVRRSSRNMQSEDEDL